MKDSLQVKACLWCQTQPTRETPVASRNGSRRLGSYSVQCTRFNAPENSKLPQLVTRVVSCMGDETRQFSPFLSFIQHERRQSTRRRSNASVQLHENVA